MTGREEGEAASVAMTAYRATYPRWGRWYAAAISRAREGPE